MLNKIIAEPPLTRLQAKLGLLTESQQREVETFAERLLLGTITASLGISFDVSLYRLPTKALVITAKGIKDFGMDVEQMFPRKNVINKLGLVVNLSLREQVQLLARIIELKPELRETIGLYNLKGAKAVYSVLNDANLHGKMNASSWFWTGEKYAGVCEEPYPEEGIITMSQMKKSEGNFCYLSTYGGAWYDRNQDKSDEGGAVVFGTQ